MRVSLRSSSYATLALVILALASGCQPGAPQDSGPAKAQNAPQGPALPQFPAKVTSPPVTATASAAVPQAATQGVPLPKPEVERMERNPAIAGSWYSNDADELAETIDGYFKLVKRDGLSGYPIALVVPHAGHQFSGPTAAHAYDTLKGRTYERVFILGPAHKAQFRGVSVPEFTHYNTPLGSVPIDLGAVAELKKNPLFSAQPGSDVKEHCIEIQLPFLQRILPSFRLVPLLISNLNRTEVATAAEALKAVLRPGDLLVISTDFTHYGPAYGYAGPPSSPIGPGEASKRLGELMDQAWSFLETRNLKGLLEYKQQTGDTICGFLPLAVLTQILPADSRAVRLHSAMSGQLTGDWNNSVSYLAAVYTGLWPYLGTTGDQGLTQQEKDALLKLARYAVDEAVKHGTRPTPEAAGVTLTQRLKQASGSFVTLKKNGELRGCIGNIPPSKPLFEGVIDNAISAALQDRRFDPVNAEELPQLQVEVSVLTTPVVVAGPGEIVLAKHGILLKKGKAAAVFLPQVAPEQGWTLEQTLQHLSHKAHLPVDGWKNGATFEVFEAIVFHEPTD